MRIRRRIFAQKRAYAPNVNRLPVVDLDQAVRQMISNGLREVRAAAMHRNDHVRVQFLDLAEHLLDVILRRRTEMEAADQRVDLLHAGNFLRLPRRIDDADMAAGADHHKALVLDVEDGGVFVNVFVRHDLALQFGRCVMRGVAAKAILDRELHLRVRQDAFLAGCV